MENWKVIKEFKDLYEISNLGNIRHYETKELKKLRVHKTGYIVTTFNHKPYYVHRLVAKYFIGDSFFTVNHIDFNKTNNIVSNLEYLSRSNNLKHYHYGSNTYPIIKQLTLDGGLIKEYNSYKEVENAGFRRTNVSDCIHGRLKTHYGYKWSY